ncbi:MULTISPECIES: eCIS core domain-containing protein [Amycolatopsis]|uniref:DUF4157 domain-containing protein n=1 Tax=Amycolatopsis albidoflavus TaxID=102226 RepID=A0ABW5IDV4_9PSEU
MDGAFAASSRRNEAPAAAPPIVHEVLSSPGQPLAPDTQAVMGSELDCDFSEVRVHTDPRAAESAAAVDAAAYTVGQHIVFGAGRYQPLSAAGHRLLAHELAHTQQQSTAAAPANLRVGTAEDSTEPDARRVAAGGRAPVSAGPVMLRRSPLTDELTTDLRTGGKGGVFTRLRARGPITQDPDLGPWIDRNFPGDTDDRWLAKELAAHGAEPRWTTGAFAERERRASAGHWDPEPGNIEASFDVGHGPNPIQAFYFPGKTNRHAMIVGGVHGTEAAGVQVVEMLLQILRTPDAQGKPRVPTFSVIVVPTLFPANYAARSRQSPGGIDPNRNLPARGKVASSKVDEHQGPIDANNNPVRPDAVAPVDKEHRPLDAQNRPVLPENLVLLDLVDRFRPERIAMVHGVTGGPNAGVSTDPRPGHDQPAVTDKTGATVTPEGDDLALAREMGKHAIAGGARAPLNERGSVTYPTQSVAHQEGVTFGMYGSSAAGSRPAMNVILIETLGNTRSDEIKKHDAAQKRQVELQSFADVLRNVFLEQP